MATPQQPELARSGHSPATPGSAKERVDRAPAPSAGPGPVPEANRPGHHPDHEQDKPEGPPAGARARARTDGSRASGEAVPRGVRAPAHRHFRFAFPFPAALAALAVGATPLTSGVELAGGVLEVRYGPWSVRTPVDNVAGAEVTEPAAWDAWVGAPRLSLPDRGAVFASAPRRRARLRFHHPVGALVPWGVLRHPSLEVTVEDPDALVEALQAQAG